MSQSPSKRPQTGGQSRPQVFNSYSHVDLGKEQDAVEMENQRMINHGLATRLQAFESVQAEATSFKHKLLDSEAHRADLQHQLLKCQ